MRNANSVLMASRWISYRVPLSIRRDFRCVCERLELDSNDAIREFLKDFAKGVPDDFMVDQIEWSAELSEARLMVNKRLAGSVMYQCRQHHWRLNEVFSAFMRDFVVSHSGD